MVDISVLGISLQEESGTPLLLLHPHGSQAILTLDLSAMEAFAVSLALHEKPGPFSRPAPHDLMNNILRALDAKLVCVRLTDLVEGVYSAEAVLSHRGRESVINCRPTDAIAIALRCGAPIRAAVAVTALARDIDEVMAILPEHVRAIAAARLEEATPRNLPSNLEQLLAALGRAAPAVGQQGQQSAQPNVQHDIQIGAPPESGEGRADPEIPRIRVALMRLTSDGKTKIMNEFTVPQQKIHIPDRLLAGLGLSPREAEAVSGTSDDERWAMLLRILAPETKVPM